MNILPPYTFYVDKLDGANARNNRIRIQMRKTLGLLTGPIWAQEFFEFCYKWKNFIKYLRRNRTPETDRELEVLGHEAEVLANKIINHLTPEQVVDYRKAEAMNMARSYDQFVGFSDEWIYNKMVAVSAQQEKWVMQNIKRIRKHHDKYKHG